MIARRMSLSPYTLAGALSQRAILSSLSLKMMMRDSSLTERMLRVACSHQLLPLITRMLDDLTLLCPSVITKIVLSMRTSSHMQRAQLSSLMFEHISVIVLAIVITSQALTPFYMSSQLVNRYHVSEFRAEVAESSMERRYLRAHSVI